jgi:hypothetical protein
MTSFEHPARRILAVAKVEMNPSTEDGDHHTPQFQHSSQGLLDEAEDLVVVNLSHSDGPFLIRFLSEWLSKQFKLLFLVFASPTSDKIKLLS